MFWKKKRSQNIIQPVGIKIDVYINYSNLTDLIDGKHFLNLNDLSKAWSSYHYTLLKESIFVANANYGPAYIFSGSGRAVYSELPIKIEFERRSSEYKTNYIEIMRFGNFVAVFYDVTPLLVCPANLIEFLFVGKPLADYDNSRGKALGKSKNSELTSKFFGGEDGENITVPYETTVATNHFSCCNSVIKIKVIPIGLDHPFPLELSSAKY